MGKHYKTHQVKNLHDLHWEQKRVRHAYKNIELNWLKSTFSTDSIISFIFQSLFPSPSKNNSNHNRQSKTYSSGGKKRSQSQQNHRATILANSDNSSKKKDLSSNSGRKNYKKLGKDFIVWQLASMAGFIVFNIARYRRKKRKAKFVRNQP